MTEDDFRRLAGIWGADIARWPGETQTAARAVAATPAGQGVLAEIGAFDEALSGIGPDVSDRRAGDVAMRVLAGIAREQERAEAGLAATLLRWLMPSAGLAMAAGLGVAAAIVAPPPGASSEGAVLIAAILDSGAFAADFAAR